MQTNSQVLRERKEGEGEEMEESEVLGARGDFECMNLGSNVSEDAGLCRLLGC